MLVGENYIEAEGIGTVKLYWQENIIKLVDVVFVKNLQCNFISVSKATNNGFEICFSKNIASVKNKNGETVLLRIVSVYMLKTEDQVFDKFKEFKLVS